MLGKEYKYNKTHFAYFIDPNGRRIPEEDTLKQEQNEITYSILAREREENLADIIDIVTENLSQQKYVN